jgi:hypothetical protein
MARAPRARSSSSGLEPLTWMPRRSTGGPGTFWRSIDLGQAVPARRLAFRLSPYRRRHCPMSAASIRRFYRWFSHRFAHRIRRGICNSRSCSCHQPAGWKMLIIDEIQHVLAGPMLEQRHFLNVIKNWGMSCRYRSGRRHARCVQCRSVRPATFQSLRASIAAALDDDGRLSAAAL